MLLLTKPYKKRNETKKSLQGGRAGSPVERDEGAEEEEEEEEDYIDSEDEREEGEKAPHENAFVYIDSSGKLVYVDPEDDGEEKDGTGLEEKVGMRNER